MWGVLCCRLEELRMCNTLPEQAWKSSAQLWWCNFSPIWSQTFHPASLNPPHFSWKHLFFLPLKKEYLESVFMLLPWHWVKLYADADSVNKKKNNCVLQWAKITLCLYYNVAMAVHMVLFGRNLWWDGRKSHVWETNKKYSKTNSK